MKKLIFSALVLLLCIGCGNTHCEYYISNGEIEIIGSTLCDYCTIKSNFDEPVILKFYNSCFSGGSLMGTCRIEANSTIRTGQLVWLAWGLHYPKKIEVTNKYGAILSVIFTERVLRISKIKQYELEK
jgi:hypothetical protein